MEIAHGRGVPRRTLERWAAKYRSEGLAGLVRRERGDAGSHWLPDRLQLLVEGLALERPRGPLRAQPQETDLSAEPRERRAVDEELLALRRHEPPAEQPAPEPPPPSEKPRLKRYIHE